MVSDIREGMPESHERMARPERVRMYSGATVRHVLEQMRQGGPLTVFRRCRITGRIIFISAATAGP